MLTLPKAISLPRFDLPSGPSYTDILHETLGPAGTPSDGFDSAMANLAGISGAFGAELNADPLGAHLGAASRLLGGVDPANLDLHMSGYVGTKEYALGIVAAAGGVVEPQLLTLPLTPGDGSTAFVPPRQWLHDFGTVKLGSASQRLGIGTEVVSERITYRGILPKGFVVDVPGIFFAAHVDHLSKKGLGTIEWFVGVVPAKIGQWTGQYEFVDLLASQLVILTLTVNVVP